MKKGILLLLFAAVIGAVIWLGHEPAKNSAEPAGAAKWSTENAVKDELARTGEVVRAKARTAGDRIDDARIIAVIKGKYVVDSNLSALAISVECHDGEVKLTGSVTAEEHIRRAVALAQQTHGVRNVVSLLVVKN